MSNAPKFGGLKIQKKHDLSEKERKPTQDRKRSIFYDPLEDDDENATDQITSLAGEQRLKLPNRNTSTDNPRNRINTDIVAQSIRNSYVSSTLEVEDPSIYAYDEVYDTMKSAEQKVRAELTGDGEKNQDRKSKYISTLQDSMKTRTQDRLMARDRLNKREREDEGDEFAGALVFESAAFKKQKAEIEALKKEEEKREEAEQRRKKGGLSSIYQKVLSQSENTHDAQVRAAAAAASTSKLSASPKTEPVSPRKET
ncbi:coiled-coil domain-containing protein 55-domain containing protein [Lipomyces arxii]|uniref:coiled-coil domain-containing protein 55-domain containing protein n=1 Tax=Lipomyces arxii TaxID=56418 RepID=UPI0034CFFEF7